MSWFLEDNNFSKLKWICFVISFLSYTGTHRGHTNIQDGLELLFQTPHRSWSCMWRPLGQPHFLVFHFYKSSSKGRVIWLSVCFVSLPSLGISYKVCSNQVLWAFPNKKDSFIRFWKNKVNRRKQEAWKRAGCPGKATRADIHYIGRVNEWAG